MKKLNKNQSGFGAIEIILTLLLVVILGAVGWYVYDKNQNSKPSSTVAKTTTTVTKTETKDDASTTFSTSKIKNYDKVPAGAQALVTADAKELFEACTDDPSVKPDAFVAIAQSNFVAVGLDCGGGGLHYYGATNGTWKKLGSGATGLSCTQVTTYKITQKALIEYGSGTCTNFDGDGQTQTIPE